MNAIRLPAGTLYVRFDELPRLLAEALHPESAEDDDNIALGAAWLDYESGSLRRAVESGELVVKNSLTRLPLSFIRGQALNRGVVMIADLQAFASGLGLSVIVEAPEQAAPAQSAAEPADPERRLQSLKALGGGARFTKGEWKFTGISALVVSEKAQGRKRSTEKTIRADLREAAENEREAKRAGFADGLGQR